jgi:hypothetical protein
MRFLTSEAAQQWLAPINAAIGKDRVISFGRNHEGRVLRLDAEYPKTPRQITYFVERAVDWLPREHERLLWLSDWETYPPHPLKFFELVRLGCGERRHIIDAPGGIFNPDRGPKDQESSAEPDTIPLIGFVLLLMDFDWAGYLVSQDAASASFICFNDEIVSFSTLNPTALDDARQMCGQFLPKNAHRGPR